MALWSTGNAGSGDTKVEIGKSLRKNEMRTLLNKLVILLNNLFVFFLFIRCLFQLILFYLTFTCVLF